MPSRSDIRSDSSDGSTQEGIPFSLLMNVYDVVDGSYIPLNGVQADSWHADSQGLYSGVQEDATAGKNFAENHLDQKLLKG